MLEYVIPALRDALRPRRPVREPARHLREAMLWMCRAQDAAENGGVSRSYALKYMPFHECRGWLPAYPETTGYIIPTFLAYARHTNDATYRNRALRMADWEVDVQMPSGAVQGGVIGVPPTPAIFNTGQVLFGWAAAYRETGNTRLLDAARRAADFLVEAMDADGAWRLHGSLYARSGVNVYDARSAWGLLEASLVTEQPAHREAAERNLDFTLTRQEPNGWFAECCLDDDARPLLHTLAYTMEGLLEAGVVLDAPRFITAARRTADALLAVQRPDGSLAGRFDRTWQPAVRWSCLTGNAQTAIVWLRLHELTHEARYAEAAAQMLTYLCSTQDLSSRNPGIRGGIAGSQPIWGAYGQYEYLNWAAKFFADAILIALRTRSA